MQICHVKGCGKQATNIAWFPAFGCCLAFCKEHNDTPESDRADWIIELRRAKQEHDACLDKTLSEFTANDLDDGSKEGGVAP